MLLKSSAGCCWPFLLDRLQVEDARICKAIKEDWELSSVRHLLVVVWVVKCCQEHPLGADYHCDSFLGSRFKVQEAKQLRVGVLESVGCHLSGGHFEDGVGELELGDND